jgi:RNA polymerase sigma-70 factor (ECF subfamily)
MIGIILMALRRALPDESDEALMERYKGGDARVFEVLLGRHERGIFGFIYRMVRDRELANDLLQETFLRVVKNAQSYSPKAKFSTWLYTIARNQCIDALRKAVHRRHPSLDQPQGADPEGRTLMEKLPGPSDDGFERIDTQQVRSRVEEAVASLSDEQREVFVMREFQRLKFNDIAQLVGVSENTIKSRMRYALENLRLALADYAQELPDAANPIPARSRV